MNAGIPRAIRDLTVTFNYNDIASAEAMFAAHPGKIACIILEAARTDEPKDHFLQKLQKLCQDHGALFILDEMITGFRWHLGGAQKYYGVTPDLSTFGKAVANGFAVSALLGRKEIMELGGIMHNGERVFLLSTTHGAEHHALAAAIATIQIYKHEHVVEHLDRQGKRLIEGIKKAIDEHDLSGHFRIAGKPCNLIYATLDQKQHDSQLFRTLFLQEMIKQGIIAPSLVVSYSHTDADIDRTTEAIGEALYIYRRALDTGVEKYLVGRPVKPVFRKYN
jgi:glutamate-1-semialdehyde 2,1-aminomutase